MRADRPSDPTVPLLSAAHTRAFACENEYLITDRREFITLADVSNPNPNREIKKASIFAPTLNSFLSSNNQLAF